MRYESFDEFIAAFTGGDKNPSGMQKQLAKEARLKKADAMKAAIKAATKRRLAHARTETLTQKTQPPKI
jgi:hypothetical protein